VNFIFISAWPGQGLRLEKSVARPPCRASRGTGCWPERPYLYCWRRQWLWRGQVLGNSTMKHLPSLIFRW